MPLYEYACNECGHTFEMQFPVEDRDDPTLGRCSMCDGQVDRCMNYGGFTKGAGAWESNNYDFTVSELHKHNDEGKR